MGDLHYLRGAQPEDEIPEVEDMTLEEHLALTRQFGNALYDGEYGDRENIARPERSPRVRRGSDRWALNWMLESGDGGKAARRLGSWFRRHTRR